MTITMQCPRCEAVIDAVDEEDLVAEVQKHVREDHGLDHTLPAEHILARLRREGPRHASAVPARASCVAPSGGGSGARRRRCSFT